MELRQLKYFVCVAEELHFGRAAERLYIAQSPLSRQIRALERELGVALLRRTTRRVELTPAGNALLAEAKTILAAVEQATAKVSEASALPNRTLRLAFTDCSAHALLGRAVRLVKSVRGDIGIDLHTGLLTPQQLTALSDRRIDVAFIIRPNEIPAGIAMHTLHTEPLVLLLPAAHPLAAVEVVELESIKHEPMVCFPGNGQSVVRDIFERACVAAGFEPNVTQTAHELSSVMDLVAEGLGCAPMPRSVIHAPRKGVVARPIRQGPQVEVAIAWRRVEERLTVREMIAAISSELGGLAPLPSLASSRRSLPVDAARGAEPLTARS